MVTTIEVRDDPKKLAKLVRERTARIVAVDGLDGAGKTTLARRLAVELEGTTLDVDEYLDKNQGYYVRALRLGDLKSAIDAAKPLNRPLLISGACLLDVLSRVSVEPDMVVYVEKRSHNSDLPCDLDILDSEERGDISHLAEMGFRDLELEQGRYHADFKPRARAEVIFFRKDRTTDDR